MKRTRDVEREKKGKTTKRVSYSLIEPNEAGNRRIFSSFCVFVLR